VEHGVSLECAFARRVRVGREPFVTMKWKLHQVHVCCKDGRLLVLGPGIDEDRSGRSEIRTLCGQRRCCDGAETLEGKAYIVVSADYWRDEPEQRMRYFEHHLVAGLENLSVLDDVQPFVEWARKMMAVHCGPGGVSGGSAVGMIEPDVSFEGWTAVDGSEVVAEKRVLMEKEFFHNVTTSTGRWIVLKDVKNGV
jgi:hypothetical protein